MNFDKKSKSDFLFFFFFFFLGGGEGAGFSGPGYKGIKEMGERGRQSNNSHE